MYELFALMHCMDTDFVFYPAASALVVELIQTFWKIM